MPEQWSIEKAQSEPAYALGSLLYLTAYAQDPNNKGRESVIPGRFLLSCASRPLEVIHSMQHYFEIYMKRMRRDAGGLAFYLQRARDLLMSFAQGVPKILTSEQSAQLAFGFAAMREAVHCCKLPEIFPNLNGANHGEEDDTN